MSPHQVLKSGYRYKVSKVHEQPPVTATYEDIPRGVATPTLDLGGDPKAFWRVSVVPRDKVAPISENPKAVVSTASW